MFSHKLQMSTKDKDKDRKALFSLLRKYAAPYWKKIAASVLLSILAAFVLPLTALVLAPVLHILTLSTTLPATNLFSLSLNNIGPTILTYLDLDTENTLNIIIVVSIAYIIFSTFYSVLSFMSTILARSIRTHISRDVAIDLHRHLLTLPLAFFNKMKTGDLISRYTEDARGMANAIDAVVGGIVQSSIQIIFCLVILIKTDFILAIIAVVLGSGHFVITRLLGDSVKKKMLDQNIAIGRLSSILQETFLTMRVIKSFAAEKIELDRFIQEAEENRRLTMRFVFVKYIQDPMRFTADAVVVSVILIFTYQSMQAGRISLEGFGLFIVLARQVVTPISSLATNLLTSAAMMGSAKRVVELFEKKSPIVDGERPVKKFENILEMKDVDFHYESGNSVLTDINLTVKKGENVAIVGASGVGKSTLIDIILRLCEPCQGTVRMDGVDIRQYKQENYRKQYGVVPQECLLFNASVRENIIYGRQDNEEFFWKSVKTANALDFISSLPKGEETLLGDRGIRLSGGQRQRIAIARALYGDPSILILDEATSSLDTESEVIVQQSIDRILKMKTAIIIAHRLSTVRHADKIIVLKDGSIEDVGVHDELYARSKTYSKLCDIQ
ncbi:MAG: ABC transporter ATP-binding protein, partial [Candidatus Electrothrix sp. AUS1_2]|nr:ABC transporter ATP-binding protein [Candidatus Electrothrix sp. AUS1_2]